jgi:hypothetical protein
MLRSLSLLALLVSPSIAQTVRIEFEAFPGPDGMLGTGDDIPIVAPSTFASQPMQLTDEFAALGIQFIPNPALNNMNEVLNASSFTTPPSHTPLNIFASSGTLEIEASFTVPVSRVKALIGISGGIDELEIYDAGGNSLGSGVGDDVDVELTSATPIARFVVRLSTGTTPTIDNLEFDAGPGTIGTVYCAPAVANSTGVPGELVATGSTVVANNDVTLVASSLPLSSFGFFLNSRTQGNVQQPGGSQGVLCLSGSIGRYVGPGQVMNTGMTGGFALQLDLTQMPTPTGPVPALAGETWNFQTWHRDAVGGVATSNFTSAVSIMF